MILKMKRWRVKVGLIILVSGMVLALAADMPAKEQMYITRKPVIVIDPGHGGHSAGVQSPAGVLEKTVTLALAEMLVRRLETNYRVQLSRTGDYDLAPAERTTIANQLKAALFISLHTGGSFLHQTDGATIFYYASKEKAALFSGPAPDDLFPDNPVPPHWESVQDAYLVDSKIFAFTLQARFEAARPDIRIRVERAPLAVLMGANMPAVVIEVGYLSHPVEEKKLLNSEFRKNIIISIEKAINEYFSKKLP